jgi:hypothetical protein
VCPIPYTLLRVTNGSDYRVKNTTTISEFMWKEAVVTLNEYGKSSDGHVNSLRPSVK